MRLGWALIVLALSSSAVAADAGYIVKPGDRVIITVFGEDKLTTEVTVPLNGEIEFPLIGTVKLAGRTGKESIAEITERLGQGLVNDPKVMLTVSGRAKQMATVMGQVAKVGVIELPADNELDVLTAIAMAGGFTEKADASRVTVRRGSKVFRVDAERMTREGAKGFAVEPRDVVIVGELVARWVTVMGEVNKPGRIELPHNGK
ncbi:MAG: polysaccharide export protein, partial [Akkermansiaceae bacterium]|nr:polysaccharide export protein [Akkermansiaceae bacterium]